MVIFCGKQNGKFILNFVKLVCYIIYIKNENYRCWEVNTGITDTRIYPRHPVFGAVFRYNDYRHSGWFYENPCMILTVYRYERYNIESFTTKWIELYGAVRCGWGPAFGVICLLLCNRYPHLSRRTMIFHLHIW